MSSSLGVIKSLTLLSSAFEPERYEDLSDGELMRACEDLEIDLGFLEIENEIFESFLMKNEPQLLEGLQQMVNLIIESTHRQLSTSSSKLEVHITMSLAALIAKRAEAKLASSEKYSINFSTKMDMAMQEQEEQKLNFEMMQKKMFRVKADLRADLEEIKIRLSEVTEAVNAFENFVITEGRDPITQKIPAERFIRFMEEWLKKADVTIGKMRLRIANLKTQYRKVLNLIAQKEYLGETVHAVDFDKIHIENQYLIEKIEQKNAHLLSLKQTNGEANLILTNFKKSLLRQVNELNRIKREITENERKIKELSALGDLAEQEVSKQEEKLSKMSYITERYKVPEVIEYVKNKAELQELKRNYKTWTRKNNLEMYTLNQHIEKMKILTGSNKQKQSWFSIKSAFSDLSLASADYFNTKSK